MSNNLPDRHTVETRLVERATQDNLFRQELLTNPKPAIEKELGITIPNTINVKVVEESSDTFYLTLPYVGAARGELSDAELDQAAGGSCQNYDTTLYGSH